MSRQKADLRKEMVLTRWAKRILWFLPVVGIFLLTPLPAFSASSSNITITVTVRPHIHLHDGTNLDTLIMPTQDTDGSGKVNIRFRIQHTGALPCDIVPGSFEYQVNGGGWLPIADADIVGQKTNLASAIDMSGPVHTLVWDTSKEYIDNAYSQNVQIRFKVTDGTFTSEYGTSPLGFNVDNLAPSGMDNLQLLARRSKIDLGWTAVTSEHSWSSGAHYEIWYGTDQADVESRSGTAQEWDPSDDPDLSIQSTNFTRIIGLNPTTTYYVKIWAVDDFGNESSLATQSITTLGDGSVTIELGENSFGDRNVPYGGHNIPMLQLKLTVGAAEDVTLSSITFNASGTGDDVNYIASGGVKLYRDLNGNGKVDASDPLIGQGNFNADDGTITFSSLSESFDCGDDRDYFDTANETYYLLVAYDFRGLEESIGTTFQTIFQQASDATFTGDESSSNITPLGTFPIQGGVVTLVKSGIIEVSVGENMPPAEDIMNDAQKVAILQIKLTETTGYEDVRVRSVKIRAEGTGDDAADISDVYLYFDNNGNGIKDDGDGMIAQSAYDADDGTITFNMSLKEVHAGQTRYLLVVYDFNGKSSGGETFRAVIDDVADIDLYGETSHAYILGTEDPPGTFPVVGNDKTIVTGRLSVETGPANPADANIANDSQDEVMLQLKLTETTGLEDIRVSSLTFTGLGTGDEASHIQEAKLFVDVNNNGIRDPGVDTYKGTAVFDSDNGTITFSLLLTIPAGGSKNLILTYNFNGTAPSGVDFQAEVNSSADVTVKGLSSNQFITPDGSFPVQGGVKTIGPPSGKLFISEGENNAPSANIRYNQTGMPMLQLKLEADASEDIDVSSITITHSGTGDPSDISTVYVYADNNSDGKLDAGDTLLGQSSSWVGTKNTVNFTTAETISASSTVYWIVVYDYAGTASVGETFVASVSNNSDVNAVGDTSGVIIKPYGSYPIEGGTKTVTDRGTLSISVGENNPSSGNILKDQEDVVMAQFKLTADDIEDITINSITLTHTGVGTPSEDVSTVRLYRDNNADGKLDASDTLISQENTWTDNTITLLPGEVISASSTEYWLVVYDFNGNASEADTFQVSINSASDVDATGNWSSLTIVPQGSFPVSGPQKTIVPTRGHLQVAFGENTPADSSILNNVQYEPMIQIKLTEYSNYEDVQIMSITFHTRGTGNELDDVVDAKIYWDNNGNGVVDDEDVGIGTVTITSDNGDVVFDFSGSVRLVHAGETRYMLVVYNFAGTAAKDETFQTVLNAVDDGEGGYVVTDIDAKGRTTGIEVPAEVANSGELTFEGAEQFFAGAVKTIVTGEISISAGPNNPTGTIDVEKGDEKVPVLQLELTETTGLEDVWLKSITIRSQGSGNEYEDIEEVRFYFDNNGDGQVDVDDTLLGISTFDADDGECYIKFVNYRYIYAGETRYLLVTFTLRNSTSIQLGDEYSVSFEGASKIELIGRDTSQPITPQGTFPIDGATLRAAADPSGKVYNSLTGEPISGAIVELWSPGADGKKGTADDVLMATNAPGGTGADGLYSFIVVNGDYYLKVTNASSLGYTFPSEVIPLGSPHSGSHGEIFTQNGPTTVDLPLDPADTKVIKLTKQANKDEVVVGDIVTYTLTIESKSDKDITLPLYVEDKLPPGFKYLSGTAQLDGQPIADPTGTRIRRFSIGTLNTGETKTLSYQLVVGSGVLPGNYYTNRARVISSSGATLSNEATERVKVTYDPIFDLSIVIGKVFNDKNADGVQQPGEEGIPDVKIATEDGLYVVTDKDGKYHIEGLKPQTKLLKVDITTLPEGAQFTTENPRVVRLTPGILAKVNFGVKLPEGFKKHVNEEGKPYLEVKVTTGLFKIDPQLTVYHSPYVPQLNLKGDALETPVTFQINTNYPDFIDKWRLEIYSLDNRVTPVRVFEGTRKDIFKQITWDGKDDKGKISEPDTTYIYVLTVEDKEGHKDKTFDKELTISSKRTVAREETPEVLTEEFYSNSLSTQTIPVEREGASVKIEGITDRQARVIVDGQDLGTVDSGKFTKELILPEDKKSMLIEARKDNKVTVYEKKLNLKKNYFFLVALGDAEWGKMKASGNIEPVRDNKKFRSGWYFDGRLAYYLKAKIKGKYLITSSFDSKRRKNELSRFIDPDKYYPIYGDSSSVVDDTNTQGKFYILVEWDKSYLTWGNYSTDITDVDLASYTRTLYGGKLHYQSVSTTKYGDPNTIFIVFGAETNQRPAHNEFLSTGGSLYYLKHTDIVEGSESVTIEVRDKDTGLVTSFYTAQRDVDYEIDYDQGRIVFYKPVSMIAASEDLISDAILLGNPIYVVVDYEYDSSDFLDEGTYGVRFAHQINDHIKIGTTYIKDERNSGYELRGYDLTIKLKKSTEFKIEYAESESSNMENFVSYDGGLTFENLPSDESSKGNALKIDFKTDLGELFNKKANKLLVEFYYQNIDAGFSSQSGISQQGTEKYGLKVTANLTDKDTVTFSYDHQATRSGANVEATNQAENTKTDEYTLQYKHTESRYTLTGEYKYTNNKGASTTSEEEEGKSHTVAGKIEYNVNEKTKVYAQQQVTLKGKSDNRTIVGAIIEFTKRLKVKLEQMVGNRGTATEIGVDSQIDSKTRMYTTYSFGREKGEGRTSTTTIGTETLVDKDTKIYTEQEYKFTDSSHSASRIIGLDYKKDKWDISARVERGEVTNQGEKTKRTTISLGTGFTEPDKLKFSAKIEFRFDRGGDNDKDQYVFENSVEYKLNPDWTLFGRLDYSRTHNRDTGKTEAEYKEFVFGGAYRPVDFDRLNLLTKLSYIEDKEPVSQEDSADISQERAFVFAIEGAYDLTKRLQLVKKFAIKRGEERVGSRDFTKTQTYLWISRFNYHITSKWDIGLEYRTLAQKQAQDAKRGFLVEVTRHINKNFQVGVGYNFTDFSDDLTQDGDYTVKGFFFRITGKY